MLNYLFKINFYKINSLNYLIVMNPEQEILEKLLKEGEGEKLDFKQRITDKNKIAKTISSFANNVGGRILIGVKDDKTIVKIDPEEEKYMIIEASEFYCNPPIPIIFKELEDEETGHTILMVKIPNSKNKPHLTKVNENEWRVYIRQSDKSVLASALNISLMKKGLTDHKKIKPLNAMELNLLSFLKIHDKITLKQFMKLVNISKRRAQRILTAMVLNRLLKVHDFEKESFYTR